MSVGLLLPSKEINGPNGEVQGSDINICYDQNVLERENKSGGEKYNTFKNNYILYNLSSQLGSSVVLNTARRSVTAVLYPCLTLCTCINRVTHIQKWGEKS